MTEKIKCQDKAGTAAPAPTFTPQSFPPVTGQLGAPGPFRSGSCPLPGAAMLTGASCRLLSPVSSLTFSWVSPAAFIKACFHRRPRPTPLPHSPFSPLHLHSRVSLNTISISGSCRTWRSPLSPHVIVIDLLVPLRTHPLHSLPSLQPELSFRSRWRKDTLP